MIEYDPDITFTANARALIDHVRTDKSDFTESDVQKFLYQVYEDGYLDARALQLGGCEIGEVPTKESI